MLFLKPVFFVNSETKVKTNIELKPDLVSFVNSETKLQNGIVIEEFESE